MNGFLTNLKPTRLFFGRQIRRAKCANLWLTNNNEFVNLQPSQFCNLKKPLICSKEFKSIYLQDCWSSQILGKKLPYSVLNLFVCLIGPQILDPVMGRPLSRGSASSPRGWHVESTPLKDDKKSPHKVAFIPFWSLRVGACIFQWKIFVQPRLSDTVL